MHCDRQAIVLIPLCGWHVSHCRFRTYEHGQKDISDLLEIWDRTTLQIRRPPTPSEKSEEEPGKEHPPSGKKGKGKGLYLNNLYSGFLAVCLFTQLSFCVISLLCVCVCVCQSICVRVCVFVGLIGNVWVKDKKEINFFVIDWLICSTLVLNNVLKGNSFFLSLCSFGVEKRLRKI